MNRTSKITKCLCKLNGTIIKQYVCLYKYVNHAIIYSSGRFIKKIYQTETSKSFKQAKKSLKINIAILSEAQGKIHISSMCCHQVLREVLHAVKPIAAFVALKHDPN